MGTGSTWETASSHPCLTPALLTGKGSPKDPEEDVGKPVKLPNSDLGPLFSSSAFWFEEAGVKGDGELLLSTGFEKVKLELVAELLVT